MKQIDVKTCSYFQPHIVFTGYFLVGLALAVLRLNTILSVVLIMAGLIFTTTHYRLRINFVDKTYHDYLFLLGFKIGEKGNFDSIKYIFIKPNKEKMTMRLRVASSDIEREVFDGYLKFSETNKIHLLTMRNKAKLVKKLEDLAIELRTKVIDYSEHSAVTLS